MPTPSLFMKLEKWIYRSRGRTLLIHLLFIAVALTIAFSNAHAPLRVTLIIVPLAAIVFLVRFLKGYSSSGKYMGRPNSPELRIWMAIAFDAFLLFIVAFLALGIASLVRATALQVHS